MPKRYLSLHFPLWSFEILARESSREKESCPFIVLYEKKGDQFFVTRASPECMKAGVKEGMTLSLAQALAPQAKTFEQDYKRELFLLSQLARWLLRFAPFISLDQKILDYTGGRSKKLTPLDYGITLDITGTERLHKSEEALSLALLTPLLKRGVTTRIGIGHTIGAAWALSRFGKQEVNPAFGFTEAMGELSIAALRIDEDIQRALKELGIQSIYDVLSLPRASLGVRFGEELPKRIHQLLGREEEVFTPLTFPHQFSRTQAFEIPITQHQSIVKATLDLLLSLIEDLKKAHRNPRSFVVIMENILHNREISHVRKELSLYAARSNLRHIESILIPLLETIRTHEGIRLITISAPYTEPLGAQAQGLFNRDEALSREEKENILNSLIGRLGENRVGQVEFIKSYVPEKSFRFVPYLSKRSSEKRSHIEERPSYFITPPERITALSMLPDSPPSRVTWEGEELSITKGIGPERIGEEWWQNHTLSEREYFKVQDHYGRWLWVYRQRETMEWFIQGIWV